MDRTLFLVLVAAASGAAILGGFGVWAVATDWYPVVPAEGFSRGRNVSTVAEFTVYGGMAGMAIGWAATLAVHFMLASHSRGRSSPGSVLWLLQR